MPAPKILYIGSHPWLERSDLIIFKSLGFDVFSTGTYINPQEPILDYVFPLGWESNHDLVSQFRSSNPTYQNNDFKVPLNLSKEFLNNFDIVVVSWWLKYIERFWGMLQGKIVLFQTIGQSDAKREKDLGKYRKKGVKIIRMSETESNFPHFAGADAIIDLAIDGSLYKIWTGYDRSVLTVNQMMWRTKECNVTEYLKVIKGFPAKLYGRGNESFKQDFNRGLISSKNLVDEFSKSRLCFSLGTKPAPVTLSFKQAMLSGCPVVTWGPVLGGATTGTRTYKAHTYIENGVNGFYSDSIEELRQFVRVLLEDHDLARKISHNATITAKRFDVHTIKYDWKKYFRELGVETL